MAFVSSPVAYPLSSSPVALESRKRVINDGSGSGPPKKRLFKKDFVIPSAIKLEVKETSSENRDTVVGATTRNPFIEDESEEGSGITAVPPITQPSISLESAAYKTCRSSHGKQRFLRYKQQKATESYEKLIAQRSTIETGKAARSFYGIDIHKILRDAEEINTSKETNQDEHYVLEPVTDSIEEPVNQKKHKSPLWTEKYRAKKFTDLVGDERTHRSVLRWLKAWDPIVFPGSGKPKLKQGIHEDGEERSFRKILMLTGLPGLGKTTLAHVCARQAGYEVVEINASDERSRDVVRGKIKDCVGTENVRGINTQIGGHTIRKAGRPVCVVVDEVDGVVSGSGGGGEGGFVKALIDLILLDQRNSRSGGHQEGNSKQKKGDKFRLLRPMILICNDVYHPSLRPLRASGLAEIVHVRRAPLEKVVTRMKTIFEKEAIPSDMDAVRRLCEATWGMASRKDKSTSSANGEGDVRAILVVAQSVASRLKITNPNKDCPRLTKQWLEKNVLDDLASGGNGARGLGRGGVRETVDRIFLEDGGFPKSIGKAIDDDIPSLAADRVQAPNSVTERAKARTIPLLRSAIEQCGEHDRVVSDLFTAYPTSSFQDDTFLSKPNLAYEWLHFHDSISSRVFSQQDWELGSYLPQAAIGFHCLFASARNSQRASKEADKDQENDATLPFSGPRADYSYHEAQKANQANLQALQTSLSLPLYRTFRSPQELATDLVPHLNLILTPDIKPVLVGGSGEQRTTATVRRESEKDKARRAAEAMAATGLSFERTRVEDESIRGGYGGYIFRMEP